MQTIATYLLESHCADEAQSAIRLEAISSEIKKWLRSKNVAHPEADDGEFASETPGEKGSYTRRTTTSSKGTVEETTLEEPTRAGQLFTTYLAVARMNDVVVVHSTLSVRTVKSILAPIPVDPRCPSIVRAIVSMFPDWTIGGGVIGPIGVKYSFGSQEGTDLASFILSPSRTLPLFVVSHVDGEPVWRELAKKLAYDLTGIGYVHEIDHDASWKLTQELGKADSCYRGAVRLYWPVRSAIAGDPPTGRVWTASALLSNDRDGRGMDRFCTMVRLAVMSVAVLAIDQPRMIREIHGLSARARLQSLEAKATAHSEELEIAKLYLAENENLKEEVESLRSQAAQFQGRAEVAEYALKQKKSTSDTESFDASSDEEDCPPVSGETRYYKKTHSKPAYDVLVRVLGCEHNKWQNASKADKAKKGIEKLEGRNDWSNINHCGSCTGGGMWRVQW